MARCGLQGLSLGGDTGSAAQPLPERSDACHCHRSRICMPQCNLKSHLKLLSRRESVLSVGRASQPLRQCLWDATPRCPLGAPANAFLTHPRRTYSTWRLRGRNAVWDIIRSVSSVTKETDKREEAGRAKGVAKSALGRWVAGRRARKRDHIASSGNSPLRQPPWCDSLLEYA